MAYIMFDDNQVVITGKIVMDFTFSHKICGECFYKTELQVKRLSDSVDTIPVLISEQIADITKSRVGEFAEIYGEFHSHNLREEKNLTFSFDSNILSGVSLNGLKGTKGMKM